MYVYIFENIQMSGVELPISLLDRTLVFLVKIKAD